MTSSDNPFSSAAPTWPRRAFKSPWIVAFAATVAYFALFLATMLPTFETSDDTAMMAIASGSLIADRPNNHLLFSNVCLGSVLAALYRQFPAMPWYGLYLLGMHFLAVFSICGAVFRPGVAFVRVGLMAAFLSIIELYQLRYLQFTNTAALCITAGFLLAASASLHPSNRRGGAAALFVVALGLCTLGILVRAESLPLIAALAIGPFAAIAASRPGAAKRMAWFAIACMAMYFGLGAIDRAAYENNSEWRGFRRFNELRNRITDLGPDLGLAFEAVAERRQANLAAAGWSQGDFELLNSWLYLDPAKFNVDSFQRYLQQLPRWRGPAAIWRQFSSRVFQLRVLPLAVLLFCVYRWASQRVDGGRAMTLALASSLLALILLAATFKLERRVVWPVLAFPALVGILTMANAAPSLESSQCRRRKLGWGGGILIALSLLLWGVEFHLSQRQRSSNAEFRADLAAARLSPATLLVSCAGSLQTQCILPLEDHRYLKPVRCLLLGWPNRTPIANRMLASFGIEDLLAALPQRQNVVLAAPPKNPTEVGQKRSQRIVDSVIPRVLKEQHGWEIDYETAFDGLRFRLLRMHRGAGPSGSRLGETAAQGRSASGARTR